MALRLAYFAPNLARSGATHWLFDMLRHADPARITWTGCWVSGAARPDPSVLARLLSYMPVHCGDPRYGDVAPGITYHATARDAGLAATANADVIVTWELETAIAQLSLPQPVCLVQHGCWWRPRSEGQLWAQMRVSASAAGRGDVVRAGIDIDRCLPRGGAAALRAQWRAGPDHRVLLCLDRHDRDKRTELWVKLMAQLDYRYKLVLVDQGGQAETRWFGRLREYLEPHRIVTTPYTEHVGDLLAAADLVCTASQREGFGRALVEAWAADRPTLCWHGLRVCDEYTRLANAHLSYRFTGEPAPRDVDSIFDDPDVEMPIRAGAWARRELSAGAAARRLEDWLAAKFSPQVRRAQPAVPLRARWLYPERPVFVARESDADWPHSLLTADVTTAPLDPADATIPIVAADASDADMRAQHVRQPVRDSFRGLLLCPHLGSGGSEQWMLHLLRHAQAAEWLVATTGETAAHPIVAAQFAATGATILDTYGLPPTARAQQISALIADNDIDVVAFWGIEHAGRFVPANYHGAIVAVSHGHPDDPWTTHWVRANSHAATHMCAVSRAAVASFPGDRLSEVDIVYPGIACGDMAAQRTARRAQLGCGDKLVIAYVGRMSAQKNPLAAARAVAADVSQQSFLLQIGEPAEYAGDLDAEIRTLVGTRGRRLPFCQDVDAWLAAADVLVLQSEYESVGLVLLQALQQGCAVIGPKRSILPELLHDDPTLAAAVCDSRDPQVVLGLARSLLPKRRAVSWQGTRFDAAVATRAFEDYCRTLVVTRGRPAAWRITWQPSQAPVACDATVLLTGHAESDLAQLQTLQQQDHARVFIHVYGTPQHLDGVRSLADAPRMRYVPHTAGYAAALCHTAATGHTAAVLVSWPGQRHGRLQAHTLTGLLLQHGLEMLRDRESTDVVLRRASLIDAIVLDRLGSSWDEFIANAVLDARDHGYGPPLSAGSRRRHAWGTAAPLPPRGVVSGFDIAIPFHGRLDLLDETVRGLLAQRAPGAATVHLIDDCNPDAARVAAKVAQIGAELRALYNVRAWRTQRNVGQFMAVNALAPHREYSHLLIHDADDVSLPDRLQLTRRLFTATDAGVLVGGALGFGGAWRQLNSGYPRGDGYWPYAANPTAAFSWVAFDSIGGYLDHGSVAANRSSLDTELFHRALARGLRVHATAATLTNYRLRPDSCTTDAVSGLRSDARRGVDQQMWQALSAKLMDQIDGSLVADRGLLRPVAAWSVATPGGIE
jgi:glycosyltransferase involved in cell wall biosynthesis